MRVLGIDVGGSGIKGAIVNTRTGQLLTNRIRYSTPKPATPKAVARVIGKIVSDLKWKGRIGIGFPAVIKDNKTRTATNVSNSWIGTDLVKLIGKTTGLSAKAINDADAAALAELKFGSEKLNLGTVVFLTVLVVLGFQVLFFFFCFWYTFITFFMFNFFL